MHKPKHLKKKPVTARSSLPQEKAQTLHTRPPIPLSRDESGGGLSKPSMWPKRRRAKALVACLATVVGLALSALTLLPRPAVESAPPLSSKDASSAVFDVVNNGIIPLERVNASVAIRRFGRIIGDPNYTSQFIMPAWQNQTLLTDEKFPVVMSESFNTGGVIPMNADIAINVSYSPWIIPITMTRRFRFVSRQASDGTMDWLPMPLK